MDSLYNMPPFFVNGGEECPFQLFKQQGNINIEIRAMYKCSYLFSNYI